MIYVSWNDARSYLSWLSRTTHKNYRLLSEAEREFVTRAGTQTAFWWGPTISSGQANYHGSFTYAGSAVGEFRQKTVVVDSFEPNPWGLYQVHGNVNEWVEDCYHSTYEDAPRDGAAWTTGECGRRGLRGGAWDYHPKFLRSAYRLRASPEFRDISVGFRVARSLD